MRVFLIALALLALTACSSPTRLQAQPLSIPCTATSASGPPCVPVWSGAPLPVTGTFTPSASSPNFTPVAAATATATKGTLLGIQYDSTQKTLTDGQQAAGSASARGALFVAVGADGFAVTNGGTFATQSAVTAASGSFASGSQNIGITPTDRTLTSATGASQTLMASNATRKGLVVQNTGNANCGVNPTGGTAAIGGAATLTLVPQGSYQPRIPTLSAVTVICTAGQPFYAEEN